MTGYLLSRTVIPRPPLEYFGNFLISSAQLAIYILLFPPHGWHNSKCWQGISLLSKTLSPVLNQHTQLERMFQGVGPWELLAIVVLGFFTLLLSVSDVFVRVQLRRSVAFPVIIFELVFLLLLLLQLDRYLSSMARPLGTW